MKDQTKPPPFQEHFTDHWRCEKKSRFVSIFLELEGVLFDNIYMNEKKQFTLKLTDNESVYLSLMLSEKSQQLSDNDSGRQFLLEVVQSLLEQRLS